MRSEDYRLDLQPKAREGAVVQGESWRITVLTDCLLRLEYQAEGNFTDEATQTVICRDFPVPEYRLTEKEDCLEIVTEKLHLYYDRKRFSPEGLHIQLKGGFHTYGSNWSFGDEIEDLGGTARTLDRADGAVKLGSGLISRGGFTVLDDSRSALLDGCWVEARGQEEEDLYFFGYGHDYIGCLRDFFRLSGRTPLLPRFALGNWWSRYYKYSERSYLELMEEFRTRNIPLSVAVVDMDWHLTDIPCEYGSGWTGYTWNGRLFPDPGRFLNRLHEMGLHVTLNVHPADGVRAYESAYPEMAEALGVDRDHGDKIPFEATDRRFMEAYFTYLHHPHEELGVDFWWIDWQQGSRSGMKGIDPLWMLNHLHFLDSGRGGRTPLILSRYAGAGSHRYPIGFSGDTFATWETLDFQPYFTVTASNIGYCWWSHDIGGHMGGRRDDELAVRWLQFGVFSPIMRLHSTANEFCGKEPWKYGRETEQIMVSFLRLRHRLVPYLYSMNYRVNLEGIPLLEPMYYRDDVPDAYLVPNEYRFGSEMIVCPITRPANRETLLAGFRAWLPEGMFFDFFTGQLYKGGGRTTLYRGTESIPVLVRAGGIVPLAGEGCDGCRENPEELEIQVFNGADGSFSLYEDSGAGEPVVTRFRFTAGKEAVLSIGTEGWREGVIPEGRIYDIRLRGTEAPLNAELEDGARELERGYDPQRKEFRIRFCGNERRSMKLRLLLEDGSPRGRDKKTAVFEFLQRAQIPYGVKSDVWQTICREGDEKRLFVKLATMGLGDDLTGAILELMASDI